MKYPNKEIRELARQDRYVRRLIGYCKTGLITLRELYVGVEAKVSTLSRKERDYLTKMIDENHEDLDRDFNLEPEVKEVEVTENMLSEMVNDKAVSTF